MAEINETIRQLLLDDATVASLVGSRVYSDYLPQTTTMPAITFLAIDTVPNESLTGICDVSMTRYQFDCFAANRPDANILAEAVRLALQKKHRGDNAGQFINEINLASGQRHLIDEWETGAGGRRFITQLDFLVHYRVAIA